MVCVIFKISFLILSSTLFLMHKSLRLVDISLVGMFEYILLMTKEANFI